jgi:hypothetical protein
VSSCCHPLSPMVSSSLPSIESRGKLLPSLLPLLPPTPTRSPSPWRAPVQTLFARRGLPGPGVVLPDGAVPLPLPCPAPGGPSPARHLPRRGAPWHGASLAPAALPHCGPCPRRGAPQLPCATPAPAQTLPLRAASVRLGPCARSLSARRLVLNSVGVMCGVTRLAVRQSFLILFKSRVVSRASPRDNPF